MQTGSSDGITGSLYDIDLEVDFLLQKEDRPVGTTAVVPHIFLTNQDIRKSFSKALALYCVASLSFFDF